MEAVVLMPGEGESIGSGAGVVKATAETTAGAFSINEGTFPAGFTGPPSHSHREMTDSFYVLEGTLHMAIGDREIDAPAGSYVLVPPGAVHTFANTSQAPVRVLNINSPAGFENYLRELAAAMQSGRMPTPEEFGRIAAKYDFAFPS
jgi:mannose-6-phosphate isomerase-like protein (cupin superfamily)